MSDRKKISILNFDLSDNSLGRAYILGQALSEYYDVEIIGPAKKGYIWEPLRDSDIKITKVPYSRLPFLLFKLPAILNKIDGDAVYAVKPRFTSFGFGLLKKFFSNKPLILDIDDWEVGFYLKKRFWNRLSRFVHVTNPNGLFWTWVMQFFIRYADRVTTVSTFLKNKYGGEIIPHAKDTDFLDPLKFKNDDLKKELGLAGKKIVMFLGTPRQHKGLEDAVEAVLMIDNPDLILMIVGANMNGKYEEKLQASRSGRFFMTGFVPVKELPRYLMLSDVVIIPQRVTPDTVGQIPSKIFDAMSMSRPIISTRVSNIPEILADCGIIVNPESPDELSSAIKWVIENPEKASQMGRKARERCNELYSLKTIREKLKRLAGELI
ncbi:MAG: glycosyltransferase family 4 protein [Nitrospirae bacterium]|nr:glycosyltransferase family 4 protein [Nitrospirota bacterium]